MGEAYVVNVIDKPNSIAVQIIRDTSLIDAEILSKTSVISSLNASISKIQAQVLTAESDLLTEKTKLNDAIDAQESPKVIIQLQKQTIIAASSLSNAKTDLSVATYKLAAAEKRKSELENELTIGNEVISIPMADSGLSILSGTNIGIAEIARKSDRGSHFIALPSERPGHSVLYEAARDGKILPKMAEQTYGWWYNEMVVPSAQIFRPRYWTATLVYKNDDTNDGSIFFTRSTDFGEFPDNRTVSHNVNFEYETTNSLSFQVGNLVLVEFSDTKVPTIIGFADLEEKPAPTPFYSFEEITLSQTFNPQQFERRDNDIPGQFDQYGTQLAPFSSGYLDDTQVYDKCEDFLLRNGFTNLTERGGGVQPNENGHYRSFIEFLVGISFSSAISYSPTWLLEDSDGRYRSWFIINVWFSGTIPGNEHISNLEVTYTSGLLGSELTEGSFNINESFNIFTGDFFTEERKVGEKKLTSDNGEPTIYDKFKNLSTGLIVPATWFIKESNYTDTPLDDQMLLCGTTVQGTDLDDIVDVEDLTIGFTRPSSNYPYTPIPTNGTQNLIQWSEDLTQSIYSTSSNIDSGFLRSPDGTENGADVVRGEFSLSVQVSDLVISTIYNFSGYLRRDAYSRFHVRISSGGFISSSIFDIARGGIVSDSTGNLVVEEIDGSWFRFSFFISAQDVDTSIVINAIDNLSSPTLPVNGFAAWGFLVTTGFTLNNYVKTNGSIIP